MSLLAAIAVLACATATATGGGQDPKAPVRVVGTYSNVRYTQEHAYGYLVDIWRQGDRIVGLFKFTDGAQTDFDTGMLDNVTYNPQTGALAFESYAGMFQFSGTLTEKAVSGRLSRAPRIGAARTEQEDVVLLRNEKATAFLRDYVSLQEWQQRADAVLKRLGPKIVKE